MVKGYDYALIAGMAATTATAFWYQVRYYKLVDDLISALDQDTKETEQ